MEVRFWGTRGSLAKPGPATVRYGGNTSCVAVRTDSGALLVLDCGTGAHELGRQLLDESDGPPRGNLLISHTHWDHIQGIPFFAPFFVPGAEWDVYAPQGFGETLRATLAGQMEYTYFPITPEAFAATIRYHNVSEGEFEIEGARIVTRYLNHPALTVGYRIESDGAALVYACDHEPHTHAAALPDGPIEGQDALHADFLAGADLVIHDAQYAASEYAEKQGWGHSTIEYAVRVCERAGVRRLAFTHHDPLRDDDAVERLLDEANRLRRPASGLEIVAAAEGITLTVRGEGEPARIKPVAPPAASTGPAGREVLAVTADADLLARIRDAVDGEGLAVRAVATVGEAIAAYASAHPPLVIVDGAAPGHVLAALTAPPVDTPTLVIGGDHAPPPSPNIESIAAGFSREYLRSRVRTWLMRSTFAAIPAAIPENEANRLAALHSLHLLDTPPEERFDRFTRLAAGLFDVPMSLVSLVDEDRQWFKSKVGIEAEETPRSVSFCSHAIREPRALIIRDASADPRFADNPMVAGEPGLRFYAGVPVRVAGQPVGTLCLADTKARAFSDEEEKLLLDLGALLQLELGRVPAAA